MPKGWFGPKRIGWGASPRSWQGWVVTIVSIAAMIGSVSIARRHVSFFGIPRAQAIVVAVVVEIAVFLLVVWATYDRDAV